MDEHTNANPNEAAQAREDALRELAIHLAWPPRGVRNGPDRQPELIVGRLPDDLPFALPIPEDTRVLGTLIDQSTVMLLDSGQTMERVMDFYHEQLTAAGWRNQVEQAPHEGGFVHSVALIRNYATYCQGDGGASLNIWTLPAGSGRISVRLELQTYDDPTQSPCGRRRQRRHIAVFEQFPPLYPPRGAMQEAEGGSSGTTHSYISGHLETDLDLPAIAEHYAAQLRASGWKPGEATVAGPVAWSAWRLNDAAGERWLGQFVALRQPERPRSHWLVLRVDRKEGRSQEGYASGVYLGSQMHIALGPTTAADGTESET